MLSLRGALLRAPAKWNRVELRGGIVGRVGANPSSPLPLPLPPLVATERLRLALLPCTTQRGWSSTRHQEQRVSTYLSCLLGVHTKQGAVADAREATGRQPEANWAAAGRAVPNRPDSRMPGSGSVDRAPAGTREGRGGAGPGAHRPAPSLSSPPRPSHPSPAAPRGSPVALFSLFLVLHAVSARPGAPSLPLVGVYLPSLSWYFCIARLE